MKIKLEKLDLDGNTTETLELEGRWKIITESDSYYMNNRYVESKKRVEYKLPDTEYENIKKLRGEKLINAWRKVADRYFVDEVSIIDSPKGGSYFLAYPKKI